MVICEINIQFEERAASIIPKTLQVFFFYQERNLFQLTSN